MMLLINGNTIGEHIAINRESRRSLENKLNKECGRVECLLNHLKKNKRLYLKLVFMVSLLFFQGSPIVAMAMDVDDAIRKIDTFGHQLLRLIQVIAYWTVLLSTSKKSIEIAMVGDRKQVLSEALKGVVIMGIIYFLPELFDMMHSLVQN